MVKIENNQSYYCGKFEEHHTYFKLTSGFDKYNTHAMIYDQPRVWNLKLWFWLVNYVSELIPLCCKNVCNRYITPLNYVASLNLNQDPFTIDNLVLDSATNEK